MSLSTHSSFDVSEDRSLLPWNDECSAAPLLAPEDDSSITTQDLIMLDSPFRPAARSTLLSKPSLAPVLPPGLSPEAPSKLSLQHTSPVTPQKHSRSTSLPAAKACALPPTLWFSRPPPKDIEKELRATVDELLKRKKDAQRGLVEENAALREEVGFLRNSLRLCSPDDSDAKQLAVALEQERSERLRSEEKARALVQYLTEQVASGCGERVVAEKALETSERDCLAWQDKVAAAMKRCEVLEEENLRVKLLLGQFAKQRPATVQHQVQSMLHDVAQERANLRRLEAIEQAAAEKARGALQENKHMGTPTFARLGTKTGKGYTAVQTTEICWSNLTELDC